jgi:hypothetical protein
MVGSTVNVQKGPLPVVGKVERGTVGKQRPISIVFSRRQGGCH